MTCAVSMWRDGDGLSYRHVKCGRPAKGERTAGGAVWPVCGIHLRSRGMIETAPGRWKALAKKAG